MIVQKKDSGKVETCATVEKFEDAGAARRARDLQCQASSVLWLEAERQFLNAFAIDERCPHCESTVFAVHAETCPLWLYRPLPGGNPAAAHRLRGLVEELGHDGFSFMDHNLTNMVSARRHSMVPEGLDEWDYILLRSVEEAQLTLGASNVLLNEGINQLWLVVTSGVAPDQGAAPYRYNNAFAKIGVGSSNVAAAAGQVGLQAAASAATRKYKGMEAGFPTVSAQTASWKSAYNAGEAEFQWREWSVATSPAAIGDADTDADALVRNLNRKAEDLGTKPAGVVWTLTVQVTLT